MNFLAADQDSMASLEETLAFIDSLNWEEISFGSATDLITTSPSFSSSNDKCDSPSQSSCGGSDSLHQAVNVANLFMEEAATKPQPKDRRGKSKRKRSTLSSSTRLQQNRKAEVLHLRSQAQEMQEFVEKLKSSKHRPLCPLSGAGSSRNDITK